MAINQYVFDGIEDLLTAIISGFLEGLSYGLFQNDFCPDSSSRLSQIEPCDFSGYPGLVLSSGWLSPIVSGERVVTSADRITFTHNSGAIGNWVYGFYVVDQEGNLVSAQRFDLAPVLAGVEGFIINVDPVFSLSSEK